MAKSKARTSNKTQSQRQLRVGELLRHALADILARGDIRDPDLTATPITVTEVRASPDLRHATAFVTPLGGQGGEGMVKALARNAAYLRGQVSRQVSLKFSPEISFQLDQSFDYAARIEVLLKHADGETGRSSARPDGDEG